jgi:hypothetical protein
MYHRLLTIAPVLALLAALAPAAPVPTGADKVLYFPTKVGAKWVQQSDKGFERTEVITSVEEKDGSKLVTISREQDGKQVPHLKLSVSPKGVFLVGGVRDGDAEFSPPMCLLKLPLKAGEPWDFDCARGLGRLTGTATAHAPEDVEVPAGKYRAVRVEMEHQTKGGNRHRSAYWFAPNVGWVKREGLEGKDTFVMKSFIPGKD